MYKLKDSNVCSFCEEEPETIEHLLWECHKVSDLWHKLNNWIFEMTYIEIPLNLQIVIFGYFKNLDLNFVKNKVILLTKFYIYKTKMNGGLVNFNALKSYIVSKRKFNYRKTCVFQEPKCGKIQYLLESLVPNNRWLTSAIKF